MDWFDRAYARDAFGATVFFVMMASIGWLVGGVLGGLVR